MLEMIINELNSRGYKAESCRRNSKEDEYTKGA